MNFFILLFLLSLSLALAQEAPVCLAENASSPACRPPDACTLYLAPSDVMVDNSLGLFAGVDLKFGDDVVIPDVVLPIYDVNKNEWSPLHNIGWNGHVARFIQNEVHFLSEVILPGAGTMGMCGNERVQPNMELTLEDTLDNAGVHRAKHATAGSFSPHSQNTHRVTRDVRAGEELLLSCGSEPSVDEGDDSLPPRVPRSLAERSVGWYESALCLDNLSVARSTIPHIGRGAFARRDVAVGDVVATSPVIHLHERQTEIQQQAVFEKHVIPNLRNHDIEYDEQVVGYQLILNYCLAHPDSNVMLLPYAPGVNFINHKSEPNVAIRWAEESPTSNNEQWYTLTPHDLFGVPSDHTLQIEYVALREICAGDEIFLDYGEAWQDNFELHKASWPQFNATYVSAAEYSQERTGIEFRTLFESSQTDLPDNLQTACYFATTSIDKEVTWVSSDVSCLRPCEILQRKKTGDDWLYKVLALPIETELDTESCELPEDGVIVNNMPQSALTFLDKPYTSDIHLKQAFRQPIGVPANFYPPIWMRRDPKPHGDFIPVPLQPGELAQIRWQDTGEFVAPWSYQLGLHKQVRQVLLEYCNRMGIREIFRRVTIADNSLPPEANEYVNLHGYNWYLQRPSDIWASNLHWLSPGDATSHEHYLQALSEAGFDQILEGVGKQLNMEGLVAFHVTFIAVSWATKGYSHYDVTGTGGKAFNIIIPLELADETGPELDVVDNERVNEQGELAVGRYRYKYEQASMVGDDAYHATSACDYRHEKQFRMAATVYVADVNENNAGSIMKEYTQAYPPKEMELLLSWAGRHWKKDDPTRKLPFPEHGHIVQGAAAEIAQK